MSRSYKKHWVLKDKIRFAKRMAAKSVRRRQLEVQDGGDYKKFYEQYDICDWRVAAWTNAEKEEAEELWKPNILWRK